MKSGSFAPFKTFLFSDLPFLQRTETQKIRNILFFCFSILFIFSFYINFGSFFYRFFVSTLVLLVSILLLVKYRDNSTLFLIFFFLFLSNYSICVSLYYGRLPVYDVYFRLLSEWTWNRSLCIVAFFLLSLYFFLPGVASIRGYSVFRSNSLIYWFSLLYILFVSIFLLLFQKSVILQKLNEYSLLFIILGNLFTNDKKKRFLFLFISLIPCLANFLSFGRVVAAEIVIAEMALLLFPKITWKSLFPLLICGIVFLSFYGILGNGVPLKDLTFASFFKSLTQSAFTLDTAVSAYYTSCTFVDSLSLFSVADRQVYFGYYSLFCLFGSTVLRGIPVWMYSVSDLTHLYYLHYYGGLLPFYFFFWQSFFGVLLISFLTSRIIRFLFLADNEELAFLKTAAGTYFCCTVFRWYLYSPYFRGLFLFLCLFALCLLVSRFSKKRVTELRIDIPA